MVIRRGHHMSRRSLSVAEDTCAYTLLQECGHTRPRTRMCSKRSDLKSILNASRSRSCLYLELSACDRITRDNNCQVWTAYYCLLPPTTTQVNIMRRQCGSCLCLKNPHGSLCYFVLIFIFNLFTWTVARPLSASTPSICLCSESFHLGGSTGLTLTVQVLCRCRENMG